MEVQDINLQAENNWKKTNSLLVGLLLSMFCWGRENDDSSS